MKRVLTAVILIPLVLLAVFRAPLWLFVLIILLIGILATLEYLRIAQHTGLVPFRRLTLSMVAGFLLFTSGTLVVVDIATRLAQQNPAARNPQSREQRYLLIAYNAARVGSALILVFPFLLLIRGMRRQQLSTTLPGTGVSAFSLFYIAFPLLALVLIRGRPFGSLAILYLFLVVWVGDIFAYYIGSMLGKHKLAPRISPGKSWEGAAASAVSAALLGSLMLSNLGQMKEFLETIHLAGPSSAGQSVFALGSIPWWQGLLLSLGINVAAQLGDLVESMLKRGAGVKDSGTLLPGHGGVLDRIDALLFAAPVLWYYATFRLIPF
jgi:phosphatidate cytidylyltransferase